jgi:integrase
MRDLRLIIVDMTLDIKTGGFLPDPPEGDSHEKEAGANFAALTASQHTGYAQSHLEEWGLSMKGIQPTGKCSNCNGIKFKKDERRGFVCINCGSKPDYYLVAIHYKGERIRRGTDLDGKTLRTLSDANAVYKQAQAEIARHAFNPAKWKAKDQIDYRFSILVNKWYEEKLEMMEDGKRAPSYVPKLNTYMRHYYLPHFGDRSVKEIFSLKDLSNKLPKRLSPKYQKNILDALSGFFKWLRDEERLISELPFVPSIEVPEHVPTVLTPEQQRAILDLIPLEHKPIFTFLFMQGVRPSEARALKWRDINGDTVCIRRTWSDGVLREQTKTKRIRYNLLFPETLQALPARKAFPDDFVFTHGIEVKRYYSHDLLNKLFKTACKALDLEGVELYEATKHSFGTWHINNGVNKDVLKEWFGHTSVKSTEIYAKLNAVEAFRKLQNSNVVDLEERKRHINAT